MNDQREWETLVHTGLTVGPMPPRLVGSTLALMLAQGVKRERVHAEALTADGGTVYLLGPHLGDLPRGVTLQEGGRVSLDGADERGQRVQLGGLLPQLVDFYLFVSGDPEDT